MTTVAGSTEVTATNATSVSGTLACSAESLCIAIAMAMDETAVTLLSASSGWSESYGPAETSVGPNQWLTIKAWEKVVTATGDQTIKVDATYAGSAETVSAWALHLLEISLADSTTTTLTESAGGSTTVTWSASGDIVVAREGGVVFVSVGWPGEDTEITGPTGFTLAQSTSGAAPFQWTLQTYWINAPKSDDYTVTATLANADNIVKAMGSTALSTLRESAMLGVEF